MPENEVKSLITNQVGAGSVESVGGNKRFQTRCNGDVPLNFAMHTVVFTPEYVNAVIEQTDTEPPLLCVSIQEPRLGQGILFINRESQKKQAAREITDALCAQAGCAGGGNCLFKRKL